MKEMTSSLGKDGASTSEHGQDKDAEGTGGDEENEVSGSSDSDELEDESDDDSSKTAAP